MDENLPNPEPPPSAKPSKAARLSALLQFVRRAVFLLLAYGLFRGLLLLTRPILAQDAGRPINDWSLSMISGRPVAEVIAERLPNTWTLLGAALGAAFLLGVLLATIAHATRLLKGKVEWLGSLLRFFGRLPVLALAAAPLILIGIAAIWYFALQRGLFPPSGMFSPGGDGDAADRMQHLILPAACLALFPGVIAAQTAAAAMAVSPPGGRAWLTGLLQVPASLFRQTGGILTALILVELIFAWPGIGRLLGDSLVRLDLPVVLASLAALAGLVLIGRLAGELFDWLSRLLNQEPAPFEKRSRWGTFARWTRLGLAVLLLFVPLGLGLYGLGVRANEANQVQPAARYEAPSSAFPLGTDALGRDLLARVRLGTASALGTGLIAAALATLLAFPGGLLAGWLLRKRKLGAELLADLALLPADMLLFLPAAGLAMLTWILFRQPGGNWAMLGVWTAFLILPRLVQGMARLWAGEARLKPGGKAVFSLLILFTGGMFAGLAVSTAVDFLGIGLTPPAATMGGILRESMTGLTIWAAPTPLAAGAALWACLWAFFVLLDGLLADFGDRSLLDWLNA